MKYSRSQGDDVYSFDGRPYGYDPVVVIPAADWKRLVESWKDLEAWRTGDTSKGSASNDAIRDINAIIARTEASNG